MNADNKKNFIHLNLTDQELDPLKKYIDQELENHRSEILYYAKRGVEKKIEDPKDDLSFYDQKVKDHAEALRSLELIHDAIRWAPRGNYERISGYEFKELKDKAEALDNMKEGEIYREEKTNGINNLKK